MALLGLRGTRVVGDIRDAQENHDAPENRGGTGLTALTGAATAAEVDTRRADVLGVRKNMRLGWRPAVGGELEAPKVTKEFIRRRWIQKL